MNQKGRALRQWLLEELGYHFSLNDGVAVLTEDGKERSFWPNVDSAIEAAWEYASGGFEAILSLSNEDLASMEAGELERLRSALKNPSRGGYGDARFGLLTEAGYVFETISGSMRGPWSFKGPYNDYYPIGKLEETIDAAWHHGMSDAVVKFDLSPDEWKELPMERQGALIKETFEG